MIGTLIMAAGNSSRLGKNKQLLQFREKSILNRCLDICRKANSDDIILVLGSDYESIIAQIETQDLTLLLNPDWKNGLSSSITKGILWAMTKKLTGVFVILPDQIHFESNLLISLMGAAQENPHQPVCSKYEEGYGAPSYFPARFFDEIINLKGNGAKAIIDKYSKETIFIDFPKGMIDIDVPADLGLLTS